MRLQHGLSLGQLLLQRRGLRPRHVRLLLGELRGVVGLGQLRSAALLGVQQRRVLALQRNHDGTDAGHALKVHTAVAVAVVVARAAGALLLQRLDFVRQLVALALESKQTRHEV